MSGWTLALIGGAVAVVLVTALCAFVLKALKTTAETTQALAVAMEQLQAKTAALAQLDAATAKAHDVSRGLAATLDAVPGQPDVQLPGRTNGRTRSARRPPR
ncbi:MAG: hypothetical protein ABIW46_01285 [Acidimicrobiales bacterium]